MVKVYAIYDSKVESYLSPFFMMSRGQALRAFTESVNDPNTMFARHPADFTLFEIGEYDDNKGDIKPYEAKISLATALELKKVDKQMEMADAGLKRLDVSKIMAAVEKNQAEAVQ